MHIKSIPFGLVGLLTIASQLASVCQAAAAAVSHGNFTYDAHDFLLNGEPFQIIAGQMDPQRIPKQYWRHRLQMARAMGLNTIVSLVFWNNIESTPGHFDFSDRNDVAGFFSMAQEEGLHIVLRPGPYICGEHEFGGFPAWLLQIEGMKVRSNNQPFLDASKKWLDRLGSELRSLSITRGGPIILAQLENEYGSFSDDKDYLAALAGQLRDNFDVPLFTDDGGSMSLLEAGTLHGVLAETDGDPKTGFEARDNLTDPTMLGPQLDCEFYITWFDGWGSNVTHSAPSDDDITNDIASLDWVLQGNNSFSIYMFHGGTNFGFESASVNPNSHVTTSYDYGAPLDETGRPTKIYHALREMISKHVPAGSIPDVPDVPSLAQIDDFSLQPMSSLFELKAHGQKHDGPVTMESLGQSYGYVLYEHTVTANASGALAPGDGPRDRVIIYVNGKKIGVIDTLYVAPPPINVEVQSGDILQLLVENHGRVDYSTPLLDQSKGIVGDVSVGGSVLKGWTSYSLPVSSPPKLVHPGTIHEPETPIFYKGSFSLHGGGNPDQSQDLLLNFPDSVKGQVYVNGINLGRTWAIGPQQELYVPGCYVNGGGKSNEVVLLELEPQANMTQTGKSVATRQWSNHPDPDLVL